MNNIGFSSNCFPETRPIEEILDFCLEHQFNFMELLLNSTNFDPEEVKESTLEWIKELSSSKKVCFSIHSPEDINFSDPSADRREESIEKIEKSIKLASQLGSITVVVHPGRVVGEYTPERLRVAFEQNVSSLKHCAFLAQEMGINLAVENLCHEKGTVNPDILSFLNMCKEIGLSMIGVALDTNHADLVDGLEKTISVIGDYVNHIHFSSNKGNKSDHCEPEVGVIDFYQAAGFFKKFNGLTIIELNPVIGEENEGPILRTRNYLQKLKRYVN